MSPLKQDVAEPASPKTDSMGSINRPGRSLPFLDAMKAFVEHPTTRLVVALILIVSGFLEAYDTFAEDVSHLRVRIGHGIILLGFINAFSSLPPVVDGIERWLRVEEAKAERRRSAANAVVQEETTRSET